MLQSPNISMDAGGRNRVSQITTLGDYKAIGYDRTLLFSSAGTGVGSWANNKYTMSVANGQYFVRQSKFYHPYFSGKSQIVEFTFDTFQIEAGVIKRMGYFSSSPTPPYTDNFDGYFIESNGVDNEMYIKAYMNGVETLNVRRQAWTNWSRVHNYDWSFFTVMVTDFLWLGGAVLNFWLKTQEGFVLLHQDNFAGTQKDTFTKSPHHPFRCEIRGESGDGTLRYVCATVGTEGSIEESGISRATNSGSTAIGCASIGTTYPILGLKKQAAYRNVPAKIEDISIEVGSTADLILWTLQLNPTLSAPLTYGNIALSPMSSANGNGTITVSTPGTVVSQGHLATAEPVDIAQLKNNFLAWLGSTIGDTMDEMVLCVTPLTSTVNAYGGLGWKEY